MAAAAPMQSRMATLGALVPQLEARLAQLEELQANAPAAEPAPKPRKKDTAWFKAVREAHLPALPTSVLPKKDASASLRALRRPLVLRSHRSRTVARLPETVME
jgi:hypothetical protein